MKKLGKNLHLTCLLAFSIKHGFFQALLGDCYTKKLIFLQLRKII
jgi:hypothetical protein